MRNNKQTNTGAVSFFGLIALSLSVLLIGFPNVLSYISSENQTYLVFALVIVLSFAAFAAFGSLIKSAVLLGVWVTTGLYLLNSTGNLSNVVSDDNVRMFNSIIDNSDNSKFDILKKAVSEHDLVAKIKEYLPKNG